MEKRIQKIMIKDLDKFALVFTEEEVKRYGLVNNDKVNINDIFWEE